MQNELQLIKQQEVLGKDFKVYGDWENPLFLAKDVAEWIGHSKPDIMIQSVDIDEKVKVNNVYVDGRTGGNGVWFLTEDGLYEVLMQSRKPIAKAFKKEVKAILKSIRKSGGYIREELLDELLESRKKADDFFKQLKYEKKITRESNKLIKTQNQFIGALKERLKEVELQVVYCENVLECENAAPVSVIAKDYGMTANKFNKLLNFINIQYKVGGVWVLYSEYNGNGYTASRTFSRDGKAFVYTVWTQRGREFLYQKLKACDVLPEYEEQLAFECDFYE